MNLIKGQTIYLIGHKGDKINTGEIVNIDERNAAAVIRWQYHLHRWDHRQISGSGKKWTSGAGKKYSYNMIDQFLKEGTFVLEPKFISHWRKNINEK